MNKNMMHLFENQRNLHVLYSYEETEKYIEQVVAYAKHGVEVGDYVILIENPRLTPKICAELKSQLTKEQMGYIHFVKSFDFYYSSGSYHPPAIQAYFEKTVEPYLVRGATFRSWAHVEWATMEDPIHLVKDFEKIIDVAVDELEFPLICAYANKSMPKDIKQMLLEAHPYILVEDDLVVSDLYVAAKA
ncbi:MEDS domain-containing protein [Planococcus sp. SE5232]|uniref:MEDS domain-containing protein n=1 Tax=unclassified Planococcus (in: firmicutes) TaxID=2662419 RepID=UPI003D6B96DF